MNQSRRHPRTISRRQFDRALKASLDLRGQGWILEPVQGRPSGDHVWAERQLKAALAEIGISVEEERTA